jgi:hypothetical protein
MTLEDSPAEGSVECMNAQLSGLFVPDHHAGDVVRAKLAQELRNGVQQFFKTEVGDDSVVYVEQETQPILRHLGKHSGYAKISSSHKKAQKIALYLLCFFVALLVPL